MQLGGLDEAFAPAGPQTPHFSLLCRHQGLGLPLPLRGFPAHEPWTDLASLKLPCSGACTVAVDQSPASSPLAIDWRVMPLQN